MNSSPRSGACAADLRPQDVALQLRPLDGEHERRAARRDNVHRVSARRCRVREHGVPRRAAVNDARRCRRAARTRPARSARHRGRAKAAVARRDARRQRCARIVPTTRQHAGRQQLHAATRRRATLRSAAERERNSDGEQVERARQRVRRRSARRRGSTRASSHVVRVEALMITLLPEEFESDKVSSRTSTECAYNLSVCYQTFPCGLPPS